MRLAPSGVKGGIGLGISMGCFFAIVAVILNLIRGPDSLDRLGVSLGAILVLYALGGVLAGAVVGLFRPIVTSWPAAIVVGILAAFPVCLCAYSLVYGPVWRWNREPWILTCIGALIFGVMGAKVFYSHPKSR